jgi:predicted transcriptional regulator
MRTPELEARHRASATVARMTLTIFKGMASDFGRKNIASTVPELLVAMVIRLNDYDGLPPLSISELTRLTGIPRQTVRRIIERLVRRGVVNRTRGGITGNDDYLQERLRADFFLQIVAAIRTAADELASFL